MKQQHFTLNDCHNYIQKKTVTQWVDYYLYNSANNCRLSWEIHNKMTFFSPPRRIEFTELIQTASPSFDEFHKDGDNRETDVKQLCSAITAHIELPPLIAEFDPASKKYHIRDGNHRIDALKTLGKDSYYCIIYYNSLHELLKDYGVKPTSTIVEFTNCLQTHSRDRPPRLLKRLFDKHLKPFKIYDELCCIPLCFDGDRKQAYDDSLFLCDSSCVAASCKSLFGTHIVIDYGEYSNGNQIVDNVIDALIRTTTSSL